eukprot:8078395-Pyramimonas_sp.AAC.1
MSSRRARSTTRARSSSRAHFSGRLSSDGPDLNFAEAHPRNYQHLRGTALPPRLARRVQAWRGAGVGKAPWKIYSSGHGANRSRHAGCIQTIGGEAAGGDRIIQINESMA